MLNRINILLLAGLWCSAPALSHHNSNSHYLMRERTEVEGVVTKLEMINPHVRVKFDVKKPDGKVEHWVAEGNSISFVKGSGWKDSELKPGDLIKVYGRPSRDGSPLILWTYIIKPDGTKLLGGNSVDTFDESGNSEERKSRFDELRKKQIEQRKSEPTKESQAKTSQ